MRSQLTGTASPLPSAAFNQTRRAKNNPWFPSRKTTRLSNQLTTAQSLLDLRVLSTINQESEHSDCQNTRDDSNQCCRIHRIDPPFSQISCNSKLYKPQILFLLLAMVAARQTI